MAAPGARIGPYRLGEEVGRGASGVVYAAEDPALGRRVALKVLSEDVARTEEQRARFAREARLLAAVSHPNVALVYGVVEQEGRVWLALEFLPGETLAEALERGPLPIEEALDVARQVADGLEAAHESGVVHRDLKPANVKRAGDGSVKVLDFGLAKPVREGPGESSGLTTEGLVVGTPLYMSPEQVRGRPVDRRTDVWAFGCVLWELLTAQRAFGGETTADVVHAILEREPDAAQLPARTPRRVRELLERCLRKDARRRLRDVGDARLELEAALQERAWVRAEPAEGDSRARGRRTPAALGAVAAVVVAAALGALAGRASRDAAESPARVRRLTLSVPGGPKQTFPRVTPDGEALVLERAVDSTPEGRSLVLRRFDAFEDVPIPDTERVDTYCFSPEGDRLAVVRVAQRSSARYELLLVTVDGSEPPTYVGPLPDSLNSDGAVAWLDDGRVAMATRPCNLLLVHTDGSGRMDEVPLQLDEEIWPHAPDVLDALPGSRVLASSLRYSGHGVLHDLVVLDPAAGTQAPLVEGSRYGVFLPPRHLLFSRADVLFAVGLDPNSLTLTGEPAPLASGLRTSATWLSGVFHASREGTVAWWPGGQVGGERRIVLLEPGREPVPWSEESLPLDGWMRVDPTSSYLTAVVASASGNYELWGAPVDTPGLRPLRTDPAYDHFGAFVSVDARELFYVRYGRGTAELLRGSLDGPGDDEVLLHDTSPGVTYLSPDVLDGGRLVTVLRRTAAGLGLLALELDGGAPGESREVFAGTGQTTRRVQLSPDARWLLVCERDEPLAIRRHRADGSLGPPLRLRTSAGEGSNAWWSTQDPGPPYRIHVMPRGSDSVFVVEAREEGEALVFSEPRLIHRLEGRTFWDAATAGGDRYLAILADPDEEQVDEVRVLFDALAGLESD